MAPEDKTGDEREKLGGRQPDLNTGSKRNTRPE